MDTDIEIKVTRLLTGKIKEARRDAFINKVNEEIEPFELTVLENLAFHTFEFDELDVILFTSNNKLWADIANFDDEKEILEGPLKGQKLIYPQPESY